MKSVGFALVATVGLGALGAGVPRLPQAAPMAGCRSGHLLADAARALSPLPGEARRAAARPALGFELGRATRAEVRRWLAGVEASCSDEWRSGRTTCRDVRAGAEAPIAELELRFDRAGVLVAADAVRTGLSLETAQSRFEAVTTELDRAVGPTESVGSADAATLGQRYLRAARHYEYADYSASVTVSNLCTRGLQVHERYRAR